MKTFAILAALASVVALAAAAETPENDAAGHVEAAPAEGDAGAAGPDDKEDFYGGGFRGYRYGYGGYPRYGYGGYPRYGGYRYRYGNWPGSKLTSHLDSKHSSRPPPPDFSLLSPTTTMKMSFVAIALALACFVSFVFAANQPSIVTSPDERMQVAKQLKELMARNPSSVDPAVAALSTEDLFSMLSGLVSNPAVLSNVGGLIKAATSGDIGAVATHATGLLGAALPAAVSAFAPAAPAAPAAGLMGAAGAGVPMAAAPAS